MKEKECFSDINEKQRPEFDSGSVNTALTRIKNTLNYSLKENYNIENPEVTEKFLRMHGLDRDRFDFINNFERLIEKGIADDSVDTNANKNSVSITGYFAETALPINKLVGYRYLYRKLKEMYGKKRAKYLSGLMYDMSLALADSGNILKPYSYYGSTVITVCDEQDEQHCVSCDGEHNISLAELFSKYEHLSVYDKDIDADIVLPSNLKVWDAENGFVKVSRILRHKRTNCLIVYATKGGDVAVVTEDHPVILESKETILAKDLKVGTKILSYKDKSTRFFDLDFIEKYIPKFEEILNNNYEERSNEIACFFRLHPSVLANNRDADYVYDITTDTGRFVANGMIQHNCFALNASKLVFEGKPWGTLPSLPPKYVQSYITNLTEVVHQLSNHVAGALAVGSFFLDIAHCMIYRDKKSFSDLQDPTYRKHIENSLQSFIHSMNHLSRNAVESPFTNISIFDRPKLLALIDDENMGWYFTKDDPVDGVPTKAIADCGDKDWKEYVVSIILDLEDIYMNIMDAGDRVHDGRPITFPVSSVNISRTMKDGKRAFADEEFVKHICKNHDIMRYNIYISEGEKIASCNGFSNPFTFEDEDGNVYTMPIGEYVETRLSESIGDKDIIDNNISNYHERVLTRHGKKAYVKRVVKLKNAWKKLLRIRFTCGDEVWVTPNHEFLLKNEELCEAKDLAVGSLLYKYLEVASIDEFDSDDYVYDVEVDNEDHMFKMKLPKSGLNLTTHNCCRLINDNELFELGGQVNSFGGSSLSLGSHRVCTINLRRAMLQSNSWDEFKQLVVQRMSEAADILIAHKALLRDLVAKGTQPFIENGWLDLDRMFSTFGIMGYYEASEDAKKRFGEDYDYLSDMITLIDKTSRELSKERKNVFNVEEIPGETMAVKLANTDRWIYGEEKVPEPLYANQFVPLWVDATLYEKFKGEGELCAQLTGGGICHYSLGEKITSEQAVNTIRLALEQGLEHFALNPTYAICENDHYTFGKHDVCPRCGARILNNLSRTVGFFVLTSNMTTVKREEDYNKRHYKAI